MEAVSVYQLAKRFKAGDQEITAIDELSLDIPAGGMVAVTGASGSGKSTLLHLIAGIESADSGRITVGEAEVTALRPRRLVDHRRRVGLVFQRYHLLPTLTALDNVIAPLVPWRVGFDKTQRARDLLAAVGLADRAGSLPGQLSGGQQQRVAIARALVARPGLLLADEPTGNLDSRTGTEILNLLVGLREQYPMTMLIATHDQHVAARADRLIRLRDGHLVDDLDLTTGEPRQSTMDKATGLRP